MYSARVAGNYINNLIGNLVKRSFSRLYYIVEPTEWSTKWDGKYITGGLNRQKLLRAGITTTHRGIRRQVVHFGSRNFLLTGALDGTDESNHIVLTWFHGAEEDTNPENLKLIKALPEAAKNVSVVHTSCRLSEANLLKWGVPREKIALVPLGVDRHAFQPPDEARKKRVKEALGLPEGKTIVGSFQKDSVGWGEGLEPKWVKGPDIFVKAIARLKKSHDIFVLLTGPSRGYLMNELDKIGVPYRHLFLKKYRDIPACYQALDLYLVASRAEGGPKAVLESMATGVPIVSTRVGMAIDVIQDGHNGFLAEIDDAAAIAEKAGRIISDEGLARRIASHALDTVQDYSWDKIARQYYEKIYRNLTGN